MKVLYVDYYYEYGNKSRGLNYIGIDGFEKALENLGNDVYHFYYDEYMNDLSNLQQSLINYVKEISPDIVFFNLYNMLTIEIETIKQITSIANTINWFGDDPFLFENFTAYYAPYFTWCITTDKFSIDKYYRIGQKNVIYSQWPAFKIDNIHDLYSPIYKYDISFVGAKNPPREWFINELQRKGIDVKVFGNGWSSGPIDSNEMADVFLTSKINLNIPNSDIWDYRFLFSEYVSFLLLVKQLFRYHLKRNYFTKKILKKIKKNSTDEITFYGKFTSQIKARNFEIPCSGGFQLTNYVPTLEEYFLIGKEIACYSNTDEAEKQIRYFLKNDLEREKIKLAGYMRSKNEYTYDEALSKIFEKIK